MRVVREGWVALPLHSWAKPGFHECKMQAEYQHKNGAMVKRKDDKEQKIKNMQ